MKVAPPNQSALVLVPVLAGIGSLLGMLVVVAWAPQVAHAEDLVPQTVGHVMEVAVGIAAPEMLLAASALAAVYTGVMIVRRSNRLA